MPFCSTRSCRPPALRKSPIVAERSPGIGSTAIRRPFASS